MPMLSDKIILRISSPGAYVDLDKVLLDMSYTFSDSKRSFFAEVIDVLKSNCRCSERTK